MRISMHVEFQILKNKKPLTYEAIENLSIGGYSFVIKGKVIPFDWDAFEGNANDGIFEFDTGYGFFNDFELSDCYDDEYEELGITRESITAEFLASVDTIYDFHINFDDRNKEVDFGDNNYGLPYSIQILNMYFVDVETEKRYKVLEEVLVKFNEGAD